VVTALYDIGRGNKAHGQEKEQSWNNYLKYFHHVLHGTVRVVSCRVVSCHACAVLLTETRHSELVSGDLCRGVDARLCVEDARVRGGPQGVGLRRCAGPRTHQPPWYATTDRHQCLACRVRS
jgi:hypothetical protein